MYKYELSATSNLDRRFLKVFVLVLEKIMKDPQCGIPRPTSEWGSQSGANSTRQLIYKYIIFEC